MKQFYVLHAGDPERPRVLSNCAHALSQLTAAKSWQVTIEQYVKPRTLKQNAALFKCAYEPLMEFMGLQGDEEKKMLHRHMCELRWGAVELPIGRRPKRTTTKNEAGQKDILTRKEFGEFYEFVARQAAGIGCVTLSPNPFWREEK